VWLLGGGGVVGVQPGARLWLHAHDPTLP
jgi:hypothetical protein